MLQETEIDSKPFQPELELDAPQQAKPAVLTGAFVQRGRDRAPGFGEAPMQATRPEVAAEPEPAATAPAPAVLATRRASRWSDVLFVVACCAAFLASFLFVLHF